MNITIQEHPNGIVVELDGKLDTGTSLGVDQALKEVAGDQLQALPEGARLLVVDCTKVPFISSAGLRVLLATGKALRRSRGELRISGLNEAPRKVFQISGFDRFFKVFPDSETALSA
ncbi:MAG: STAS domain-containing protein [Deltaproteobacteria bacterium]|nr:STAS domain-containing protein [Deltaproteobacteria bacterium]